MKSNMPKFKYEFIHDLLTKGLSEKEAKQTYEDWKQEIKDVA